MSNRSFLTSDGCRLAYESVGEGLPVVWQHGLGADRRQPADVFPEMQGIRRITLECRGHGASELGDADRLSIASFSEDVIALMDHLGLSKAVVGGISLGGAIALRLAALHPERTCGLILARPAWVDGPSLETMSPYAAVARSIAELGTVRGVEHFLRSEELQTVRRVSPDNALSLQTFFTQAKPENTVQLLSRIAIDAPAVGDLVSTISVPTLIIANDQEFVHPLAYALALHDKLPHATLQVITSKTVDARAYREEFARSVRAFLSSLERAS